MNVQILIQEKLSDFEGRTVDDEEVEGIRYSSAVILLKKCRTKTRWPTLLYDKHRAITCSSFY